MVLARRKFLLGCFAGTAGAALPSRASAESYPLRPITIIVPFPPGGPSDVIARIVAERMREALGQPLIIENVSGAAGSIGTGRVVRAAPDGHTLVLGYWGTHVVNGAIYKLPYDVVKDFEPIARLPGQPLMIVAKKALPASDLKGLVAWLKSNPDKASQGTAGTGSIGHIAGLFFQKATDTRFQFVPYRGVAPIMQDLLAGQIDLAFPVPVASMAQARAGLIKAYAVMAKSRLAIASEIPTVDEAGVPGLHLSLWQGLWAPRGTPPHVIAKLSDAVVLALADPAIRQKLADQGFDMLLREQQSPAALGAYQRAEIDKWWPILRAANVKGD
ncbi:MAG: tripartite tricarboxylate transporter substrate binding protein BugD [Xanthobacteraceae bacterium]|nr:tripartite tricarboxylate transporter substrate binding protein BugD [Xanthobacteraceae bacterium]